MQGFTISNQFWQME